MSQRLAKTGRALPAIRAVKNGLSPGRLLIAAAIFHLTVTAAVFGSGRFGLLPGTFNRDGIAVSFAPDGVMFHDGAAELSELLRRGDFGNWIAAHQPFHVRLYSICYAIFGPLVGKNIISAEPLNGSYYLAILALVFNLGRGAFGRRAGLLAAGAVALWPSLLLHTTQPLRDQLFIIGALAFVLIVLRWLTRTYTWPEALSRAALGGLTAVLVWLARDNMAVMLIAAGLLGAGLLALRQFAPGRVQAANLVGMALMLALVVGAMRVMPKFRPPEDRKGQYQNLVRQSVSGNLWERAVASVGLVRARFVYTYPDAGSNIDSDVQLDSFSDIVRYSPRAAAIGFFAPFPDTWFAPRRSVGSSAKALVGVETLMLYLVEVLAVCGLWLGRRRLAVWLLFLTSAAGMFVLGLVVVNVGALYRLRYLFLITLIVLAAGAVARALSRTGRWGDTAEDAPSGSEARPAQSSRPHLRQRLSAAGRAPDGPG